MFKQSAKVQNLSGNRAEPRKKRATICRYTTRTAQAELLLSTAIHSKTSYAESCDATHASLHTPPRFHPQAQA